MNKPYQEKEARVLIGVPSGQFWHATFAMSLLELYSHTMITKVPGYASTTVSLNNAKGSMIWINRQNIADKALEIDATHLLFIDTDMTFPPNLLEKLLSWKKDIVACNCTTKLPPFTPTARLDFNTPLYVDEEPGGLRKVFQVGTGVMLIHTSVFKRMKKPWFPIIWKEEAQKYQGEDWSFIEQAKALGIPIYVDQDISCGVGHLGEQEYTHVMSLGARDGTRK